MKKHFSISLMAFWFFGVAATIQQTGGGKLPLWVTISVFVSGMVFFLFAAFTSVQLVKDHLTRFDDYIADLEKRCQEANFAPYDTRVPDGSKQQFVWDYYTIQLAEQWLADNKKIPCKPVNE